ncbi:hypothetical protein AVDCRST_MAG81-2326 [uncultured Synechococcales cyanobacterium]|uniref:HTH luxR-type domain-containing protein n=1 Tax=uncultured Synechococcales cyanobacterium TaxID=1936017 RepID=A0A6J4VGS1_9CYAN|nr:hypothetical protein AVDCRST_MAG81-2326 [uncultured Synechococcales cyanobacterium]
MFWIAQGKNNTETAQLLSIGSKTVKKYVENIYQKLGVQTRASAVVRALERLGLLYL